MITAVDVYQSSKSYILNRFRQVHPLECAGLAALCRFRQKLGSLKSAAGPGALQSPFLYV
jgi:hypothetical protein